jgi:hypothetical protein
MLYPPCELIQPRSLTCGACVVRDPLVGQGCLVASCVLEEEERDAVVVLVFLLNGQGQNRLFMSHFVQATVERTTVATSTSSPGTGHAGHG